MKRTLLALILAFGTAQAEEPQYQPEANYDVLAEPIATNAPEGKTEVLDFFWYGCPHCYRLAPLIESWEKANAETMHVVHLPAVSNSRWAIAARVYFTLQEMDRLDMHMTVFRLIHEQKRQMRSGEAVARMLEPFGVDAQAFETAFHGEAVAEKMATTKELTDKLDLGGVPALVVDGRYVVNARNARSYQEIVGIADFLVREKP